MKVALFGATGKSGKLILNKLLERQHKVIALVRNPSKLNYLRDNKNLIIIQGDILNYEDLEKTVLGTQAVISAIGRKKESPPNMQEIFVKNLTQIMGKSKINRLIVLTGAGLFCPGDKPSIVDKILTFVISLIDKYRIQDARNMVKIIENSNLDWTIVRTHLQYTKTIEHTKYNIGRLGDKNIKLICNRELIAEFITQILESQTYLRQYPVISD